MGGSTDHSEVERKANEEKEKCEAEKEGNRKEQQGQEEHQILIVEEINSPQSTGEDQGVQKEKQETKAQSQTGTKASIADPELTKQLEELKNKLQMKEEEIKKMHDKVKQQESERQKQEERRKTCGQR